MVSVAGSLTAMVAAVAAGPHAASGPRWSPGRSSTASWSCLRVHFLAFQNLWWSVVNLLPDPAARRRQRHRGALRHRPGPAASRSASRSPGAVWSPSPTTRATRRSSPCSWPSTTTRRSGPSRRVPTSTRSRWRHPDPGRHATARRRRGRRQAERRPPPPDGRRRADDGRSRPGARRSSWPGPPCATATSPRPSGSSPASARRRPLPARRHRALHRRSAGVRALRGRPTSREPERPAEPDRHRGPGPRRCRHRGRPAARRAPRRQGPGGGRIAADAPALRRPLRARRPRWARSSTPPARRARRRPPSRWRAAGPRPASVDHAVTWLERAADAGFRAPSVVDGEPDLATRPSRPPLAAPAGPPDLSGGVTRPFLVGVAGGSGSGKTTVAERLAGLVGEPDLALVRLDAYYCDRNHLPFEERAAINYDHPDAFDWPLLLEHVAALQDGPGRCRCPVYDFATYERLPERVVGGPGPGRRGRGHPRALRARAAGAVRPPGVRRHRRRTCASSGASSGTSPSGSAPSASVIEQYLDTVRPEPRAVHRAEQAPRRRDHPARRHERPGPRRPAGAGARAPLTESSCIRRARPARRGG